jgi:D-arginine dehydrogenase
VLRTYDFAVIGAGIAGASVAYELQSRGRTILLEREPLPGHHTTGRSAAFLVESYGNPVVQLLTRAARTFLEQPPDGFSPVPLLHPCPVLWVARPDQLKALMDRTEQAVATGAELCELNEVQARSLCPVLRDGYVAAAVVERRARHIDVAALLEAYLRGFRARGGKIVTRADVNRVCERDAGWEVVCESTRYQAAVVVNAAGAWAEEIGKLAGARPIGLMPLRRTAITFDPPQGTDVSQWACVIDAEENFYLKPEGRQLLASPCDETPYPPSDVTADDLEIALAAERVMSATTLDLRHIRRSWAGLRSFVADRAPVIGMDPNLPGFFWLAGQGGFGIMTSSSAARAAAALILDDTLPGDLKRRGLTPELLSPSRPALFAA